MKRQYLLTTILCLLLGGYAGEAVLEGQGPFSAQIVRAFQSIGLWPADGTYAAGQVPVYNATTGQFAGGAPVPGFPATCAATGTGVATTATPSVLLCVNGVAVLTGSATALTSTVPGAFNSAALGTTSTSGLSLINTTAATAGVPNQISPRYLMRGTAWDTSASQTVDFFTEVLPATAATPTGTWKLGYSLNGAAVTYPMTVTNSGFFQTAGGIQSGSFLGLGGGSYINWNGRSIIRAPTDGTFVFENNAQSAGFGIDGTIDSLLKVRTRAQTGYAGVDALLYTTTGYSSGARVTASSLLSVTEAVTLSGASTATAAIIPAGATVEGIATTTTTTITGASGYQVGDGADADRYGDITGTAVGTISSSTSYTADPRWWTAAARAVTLTAKTSNFTGGVVQVTVFYRSATGS